MIDWITQAAREIASFSLTLPEDHYREIIARHVPYKKDVVYMPVPRCKTCKYWVYQRSPISGSCGRVKDIKTNAYVTSDVAELVTSSEFGCVQWEEK